MERDTILANMGERMGRGVSVQTDRGGERDTILANMCE